MPPWCGIKAAFYVLVQKRGEKEKDGAEEEEDGERDIRGTLPRGPENGLQGGLLQVKKGLKGVL